MIIKESAENYLEAILMLKNKNGYVRSIDIAHELNFSKASVSVAMKNLREEGYVTTDSDGGLELTEKGMEIAKNVYDRHDLIAGALIALGVNEKTAYEDSCKIEHCLSQESFEKIKAYVDEKMKK